jgi:hypothetical protein
MKSVESTSGAISTLFFGGIIGLVLTIPFHLIAPKASLALNLSFCETAKSDIELVGMAPETLQQYFRSFIAEELIPRVIDWPPDALLWSRFY